jgi:hypothetical protein
MLSHVTADEDDKVINRLIFDLGVEDASLLSGEEVCDGLFLFVILFVFSFCLSFFFLWFIVLVIVAEFEFQSHALYSRFRFTLRRRSWSS